MAGKTTGGAGHYDPTLDPRVQARMSDRPRKRQRTDDEQADDDVSMDIKSEDAPADAPMVSEQQELLDRIDQLQAYNDQLQTHNGELKKYIADMNLDNAKLATEKAECVTDKAALHDKHNTVMKQFHDLNGSLARRVSEKNQLMQENAELVDSNAVMRREHAEAFKEGIEKDERIQKLETQVHDLTTARQSDVRLLAESRRECLDLQRKLNAMVDDRRRADRDDRHAPYPSRSRALDNWTADRDSREADYGRRGSSRLDIKEEDSGDERNRGPRQLGNPIWSREAQDIDRGVSTYRGRGPRIRGRRGSRADRGGRDNPQNMTPREHQRDDTSRQSFKHPQKQDGDNGMADWRPSAKKSGKQPPSAPKAERKD